MEEVICIFWQLLFFSEETVLNMSCWRRWFISRALLIPINRGYLHQPALLRISEPFTEYIWCVDSEFYQHHNQICIVLDFDKKWISYWFAQLLGYPCKYAKSCLGWEFNFSLSGKTLHNTWQYRTVQREQTEQHSRNSTDRTDSQS